MLPESLCICSLAHSSITINAVPARASFSDRLAGLNWRAESGPPPPSASFKNAALPLNGPLVRQGRQSDFHDRGESLLLIGPYFEAEARAEDIVRMICYITDKQAYLANVRELGKLIAGSWNACSL